MENPHLLWKEDPENATHVGSAPSPIRYGFTAKQNVAWQVDQDAAAAAAAAGPAPGQRVWRGGRPAPSFEARRRGTALGCPHMHTLRL